MPITASPHGNRQEMLGMTPTTTGTILTRIFSKQTGRHNFCTMMAQFLTPQKGKMGWAHQKNFWRHILGLALTWLPDLYQFVHLGHRLFTAWNFWPYYWYTRTSWLYDQEHLRLLPWTPFCRLSLDGHLKGGNSWLWGIGQPTTLDITLATGMYIYWIKWKSIIPTSHPHSQLTYCDGKRTGHLMHDTGRRSTRNDQQIDLPASARNREREKIYPGTNSQNNSLWRHRMPKTKARIQRCTKVWHSTSTNRQWLHWNSNGHMMGKSLQRQII